MSRVTAIAIDAHPSGAQPSTVTCGALWTYGSWVQVIASAGADLHLAGVALGNFSTAVQFEIEIGIGAASSEVGIHTYRSTLGNAASDSQSQFALFPVPLGGISNGDRVSVRARSTTGSTTIDIGLLTYSNLSDTDHLTDETMSTAPSGANAASITPSATPWAWSSWVELFSGTTVETAFLGIASNGPVGGVEMEYEIGLGAGGAEVPKTLIRTSQGTSASLGAHRLFCLPAALPVPPNTRVAIRMRKTGTSTTAHAAAMLYLNDTDLNTVELTVSEALTVTDHVTAQLTNDIYLTVFETITVAEALTRRESPILLTIFETISLDDEPSIPLGTTAWDRVFVRDYVAIAPNALVVHAHETITVTDSALNLNPDGVPSSIGPEPSAPAGATGVADYWVVGL